MVRCVLGSSLRGLGWSALWFCLLLLWTKPGYAEDESPFAGYQRSSAEGRTTLLPFRVDAHASLTWEADVGAGLRLDIPVMSRSRMRAAGDELAISVGADVSFVTFGGSDRLTAWPVVMGQWTLGVSERFAFYPEVGLVARFEGRDFKGVYPGVGFGGRVQLYKMLSLLGRLGWPMAVSIGLTF